MKESTAILLSEFAELSEEPRSWIPSSEMELGPSNPCSKMVAKLNDTVVGASVT